MSHVPTRVWARKMLTALREQAGARGRCHLDYADLVFRVKANSYTGRRPTLAEAERAIRWLADHGHIQIRRDLLHGGKIVVLSDGVNHHEAQPQETSQQS
jgi:hypothetical protein